MYGFLPSGSFANKRFLTQGEEIAAHPFFEIIYFPIRKVNL